MVAYIWSPTPRGWSFCLYTQMNHYKLKQIWVEIISFVNLHLFSRHFITYLFIHHSSTPYPRGSPGDHFARGFSQFSMDWWQDHLGQFAGFWICIMPNISPPSLRYVTEVLIVNMGYSDATVAGQTHLHPLGLSLNNWF